MPIAPVAAAAILVSDGSVGARRLHRVLSTVADLGVSRVLDFGPDLPRTLSRCAGELIVAYVPGEFEAGLRLLDAVHDSGRAGADGPEGGPARIVLVGGSHTPGVAAEALRRGACGYLANTLSTEQMRSALAMLVAWPGGSRVIALSPPEPAPRGSGGRLSEREQEVIDLIARACTNAQIARRLGIAEGTVKRHVNSIFVKLQAVSRLDAVNKYRELASSKKYSMTVRSQIPGPDGDGW
jgi:DNA-binding NarL/FixJ family response regulator